MKSNTFLSAINGTAFGFYYIAALVIVPQFAKLFAEFGGELPLPTRLVLTSYPYWWLVAGFFLLQFALLRYAKPTSFFVQQTLLVLNILFVILDIMFIPLLVIAFYLPIFQLGAQV